MAAQQCLAHAESEMADCHVRRKKITRNKSRKNHYSNLIEPIRRLPPQRETKSRNNQ